MTLPPAAQVYRRFFRQVTDVLEELVLSLRRERDIEMNKID
jgi:hypothetical protein